MSDSSQVPTVWKSVHVGEEVVLRRQVTVRTERVRETLRRDVVDVEHGRAEVPAAPAPKQRIEAEGAERHAEAQGQAVKQPAEAQAERKPANQGLPAPQLAPRKN